VLRCGLKVVHISLSKCVLIAVFSMYVVNCVQKYARKPVFFSKQWSAVTLRVGVQFL